MWVDQRGSEIIPLPECLRLLAMAAKQGAVGRLAVSREQAPLVQPVNFAYRDRRILLRLGRGAMATAATGGLVAFEVDHLDRNGGAAWSVLVRGLAVAVDEADPAAADVAALPLVPSPGDVVLAIRLDVVTGRRFMLHAIPAEAAGGAPDATDPDGVLTRTDPGAAEVRTASPPTTTWTGVRRVPGSIARTPIP
ncbi:MAG TPA: pyridoxamine 5'-phosphate oxidase family protein [Acidimicrobiales bacterium]|nr:pyridoxamine 5'-phosphate oxidase family protein [Acidimicrobiales bacterium]